MPIAMLRSWTALLAVIIAFGPVACTNPHQYIEVTCAKMAGETVLDRETAIQCQTFRQAEAATAVYNEALLFMKSYRVCLAKYEQTPGRAKEYCSEYSRALAEITCSKVAGEVVLGPEVAARCESTRQADAATAVYNEAMLLVRSYRGCLQKYEQTQAQAREYCAQYPKALREIGLQIKEQPEPAPPAAASSPARPR